MANWTDYWWAIALFVVIAALLLFLLLRPRQSVRLSDAVPTRPHMASVATATPLVAPTKNPERINTVLGSPVHTKSPDPHTNADDLTLIKGVGPKLADLLHSHGIYRFHEIATLGAGQIEALDRSLGAFAGRLVRDRIIEQADYLARGDVDGFEAKFGKL